MTSEAVAITGIGMFTPLGSTRKDTIHAWEKGIAADCSGCDSLRGTVLESQKVAVLPYFDPAQRLKNRKLLKFMSVSAVLGCLSAREALEESGACRRFDGSRIGLFAATGLAGIDMDEAMPMIQASVGEDGKFSCTRLGASGLAAANPLLSFKILANMPPCIISISEGIKGPNLIFTPWEGQAAAALREAWLAVASGEVDCALAGGADNAMAAPTIAYLRKAALLSENESASAGSAYAVMEKLSTAIRDNRRVYAVIRDIDVSASREKAWDPLAERMGRTYAAAPSILMGLACQIPIQEPRIIGTDGMSAIIRLENWV